RVALPRPVAQDLVAHDPEAAREAEHVAAVAQVGRTLIRPREAEEAVAHGPVHVGLAATAPGRRREDPPIDQDVARLRAARPRCQRMRVVPAGAGSDDEEAAADGALEREAAAATGAGARGVED